jgi:hypothetical protein
MNGHFSYYAMCTPNVGPFRTSRSLSQSERRKSELSALPARRISRSYLLQDKKFDNDSDSEPETERLLGVFEANKSRAVPLPFVRFPGSKKGQPSPRRIAIRGELSPVPSRTGVDYFRPALGKSSLSTAGCVAPPRLSSFTGGAPVRAARVSVARQPVHCRQRS